MAEPAVDGDPGEEPTGTLVARWSGSAAIPPPIPRRRLWGLLPPKPPPPWARVRLDRTATLPDPDDIREAASRPGYAAATHPQQEQDWENTPPVDPWADHDTLWQSGPGTPPMPPTPPPPTPPAAPPSAPAASWRGRLFTRPSSTGPSSTGPSSIGPSSTGSAKPLPGNPPPGSPRVPRPPAAAPPTSGKSARPRRRRKRWPKALFALVVLGGAAFAAPSFFGLPYLGQYPVSATLPDDIADLHLRQGSSSDKVVERLTQSLRDADVAGDEVFAGIYGDDNGKRVTLFGTTGFRLTPQSDVEAEIRRLTGEYDITDIKPYDLWETGAHQRCGIGRSGGSSVVVCSWADHGSLATVLLTRRSRADSAVLVAILRTAILSRG